MNLVENLNLPINYLPILIQAVVALGFVAVSLLGAHFLGPRQKKTTTMKNQSFECGVKVEGKNTIFGKVFSYGNFVRPF